MKKVLSMMLAGACTMTVLAAKELKVLPVGNSFSWSASEYFPKIVNSVDGLSLVFEQASLGGCPLERHWKLVEQCEANPKLKPYTENGQKFTLREKLESKKWDIVTIQQASAQSWVKDSYQPYAKNLYDYIKKYAPQAEVVIQETWAYRPDEKRLGQWKIGQQTMYDNLAKNYRELAKELNCRVLPVGDAVQMCREAQKDKFVPYDMAEVAKLKYPDPLPDFKGSLVSGWHWVKSKDKSKPDEYVASLDAAHLNNRGKYLQCCVWFAVLYGRPTSEIKFVPEGITPEDAAFLREIAQKAVDSFKL